MTTCIRCGAEIPDGVFVCPVCGLDVQLVPDYETLDLDMMLLQNYDKENKIGQLEERREARRRQMRKSKRTKALCSAAIAAFAVVGITIGAMNIRSTMADTSGGFEAAYDDALKMYEDGEYQDAYNAINTALGYDDDSIEALVLKARIAYFGLENMDEAVTILRNIISAEPSSEAAYEALLEIYAAEGEYDIIADVMDNASDAIREAFSGYIVNQPSFSPNGSMFSEDQDITLSADSGCEIYYTTEASAEFEDYILYSEPVHVTEGSTTITAIAVNADGIHSRAVKNTIDIVYDAPAAPVFATSSGIYEGDDNKVAINGAEGCTIYFAVDGKPSTESTVYSEPFEMREGKHFVYAIAVNEKGVSSGISAIWYEYTPGAQTTAPETPQPSYDGPSDDYWNVSPGTDDNSPGNSGGSGSGSSPGGDVPSTPSTPEPTDEPTHTPEATPTPEPTDTPEATPEPEQPDETVPTPEPEVPDEQPAPPENGGGEESPVQSGSALGQQ